MRVTFIFLLFYSSIFASAQKQPSKLERMFLEADTVYLVRHIITAGVKMVDKETGKEVPFPPLLVNGRPNYSIWQESKVLKDTSLKKLTRILSRPYKNKSRVVETCNCIFTPSHAIFVIKGNKTSFLNFGFMSDKLEASNDFPLEEFDGQRWNELYDFSEQQGLLD